MSKVQKHPILAGLIALVAVAISIGLILGVVVLIGTHVLGIGDGATTDAADDGASLYLPSPSPTETASGPAVTLSPDPSQSPGSGEPSSAKPSKTAKRQITLQASAPTVSSMQSFTISGDYPDGEGSLMRLQRKVDGAWQDFGIPDVAVTDSQFSTTVQTGRAGVQKFRMKDMDHDAVSNVVTVTVG